MFLEGSDGDSSAPESVLLSARGLGTLWVSKRHVLSIV